MANSRRSPDLPMSLKKLSAVSVTLLLAAAAMVALVPTASAQDTCGSAASQGVETRIALTDVSENPEVQPLSGTKDLSFNIVYGYSSGQAPGVSVTGPTTIDITPPSNAPSWMTVSVSPTTVYLPVPTPDDESGSGGNPQSETEEPITVSVSLGAAAPAQAPDSFSVSVTAQSNGDMCSSSTSRDWQVTPKYYDITGFSAPSTFSRSGPSEKIAFPVTVQNGGNGATYYQFEITQQPDNWEIPLPFPQTIQSQYTGGEGTTNEGTVTVDVSSQLSTQYYNDIGVINMKTSPFFAQDKSITGTPITISLIGHFQGVYVPGFEMLGAAGAFVALALIRRWKP